MATILSIAILLISSTHAVKQKPGHAVGISASYKGALTMPDQRGDGNPKKGVQIIGIEPVDDNGNPKFTMEKGPTKDELKAYDEKNIFLHAPQKSDTYLSWVWQIPIGSSIYLRLRTTESHEMPAAAKINHKFIKLIM